MQKHVELLGMLYAVAGGLWVLVGISVLSLAAGAATLIRSTFANDNGVAAGITAATFGVLAVATCAWGAVQIWTGLAVRQRQPWSRVVALGLGVANLFILPLGTALGIYTVWVLLNDEGRRFFAAGAIDAI